MCGICGFYKLEGKKKELELSLAKMNSLQKRRGPDDEGVFLEEIDKEKFLGFGHTRLSILDLSKKGRQPMIKRIGKIREQIVITFNGEIYNFLEIEKVLKKKGYSFETKTDTEVILALYQEYGEKSFSMLRGMFAFGLWDGQKRKLFLVRDRYGIKPLYYSLFNNQIIFSSTVKAIENSRLIPVEGNKRAWQAFLLFGSVPYPLTTLKEVFSLPAGHYLAQEEGKGPKIIKYYDFLRPFLIKNKDDFNQAVVKTKELLTDSVKKHLISDAPLGVFLSGGLDSSVIAALAAGSRKTPITTLSIDFEEEEFSEKKFQNILVQKIKSNHKEIKIKKSDFFEAQDDIFSAMDQPTIDGVNTYFIAKAAKEMGVKTVLSGLGSDEIFFGYSHFKRAELLRIAQNLYFRKIFRLSGLLSGRFAKLDYLSNEDFLSFYLAARGLFTLKEAAAILGATKKELRELIEDLAVYHFDYKSINGLSNLSPANAFSFMELKFYLQNQLLKDTDFMSMHHSIEVRVPFLDHPLVEYVSSLPAEIKFSKSKEDFNKPLLVGAVKDIIPHEILKRPKMGFTFPFEKWLRESEGQQGGSGKGQFNHEHWSRSWARVVLNRLK